MPTWWSRLLFFGAIAAYLLFLLSGRCRTPLQGFTGLAACGTFIYLLDLIHS